ncbi:restriction endonuclease [Anaerolineales bacterium HSG6]|nr:restriction endonuclease [Anaerolineales bacterium HSG6]
MPRRRYKDSHSLSERLTSFLLSLIVFLCCASFLPTLVNNLKQEIGAYAPYAPVLFACLVILSLMALLGNLINPKHKGKTRLQRFAQKKRAAYKQQQKLASLKTNFMDLSAGEFEAQINYLLQQQGYSTTYTGNVNRPDGGIDIKAEKNGQRYIVQCKRQKAKITGPNIDQFLGTLSRHSASKGIYVTTSDFTKSAQERAKGRIKLVNGSELLTWIKK